MRIKRAITILKYLEEKTDINNSVTVKQLQEVLELDCIEVDRNTIKRDIEELMDCGIGIKFITKRHNTFGYYIENRFTIGETRILLDGVASNKFVDDKQKREIKEKLLSKVSRENRIKLKNQVITNTFQNNGVDILYNLERIHTAIAKRRYIKVDRVTRDTNNNIKVKLGERKIIPYAVYYENDRYYLIVFTEDNKLRNYRVDRIKNVKIEEEHNNTLNVDLQRYSIRHFDMFPTNKVIRAEFKVNVGLKHSVIEKFGDKIFIRKDSNDEEKFIFSEEVGFNDGLIRWILKQGSQLQVLYPEELKVKVKEEINKMYQLY